MKAERCAARRLYDDTGIEPVDCALPSLTDQLVSSLIRQWHDNLPLAVGDDKRDMQLHMLVMFPGGN